MHHFTTEENTAHHYNSSMAKTVVYTSSVMKRDLGAWFLFLIWGSICSNNLHSNEVDFGQIMSFVCYVFLKPVYMHDAQFKTQSLMLQYNLKILAGMIETNW